LLIADETKGHFFGQFRQSLAKLRPAKESKQFICKCHIDTPNKPLGEIEQHFFEHNFFSHFQQMFSKMFSVEKIQNVDTVKKR
jgi:hypothetical protein